MAAPEPSAGLTADSSRRRPAQPGPRRSGFSSGWRGADSPPGSRPGCRWRSERPAGRPEVLLPLGVGAGAGPCAGGRAAQMRLPGRTICHGCRGGLGPVGGVVRTVLLLPRISPPTMPSSKTAEQDSLAARLAMAKIGAARFSGGAEGRHRPPRPLAVGARRSAHGAGPAAVVRCGLAARRRRRPISESFNLNG